MGLDDKLKNAAQDLQGKGKEAAGKATDAGFEVRGPLESTTMHGGPMWLTEVVAGGVPFELLQFG